MQVNQVKVFKTPSKVDDSMKSLIYDPSRCKWPISSLSYVDFFFESKDEASSFALNFVPIKKRELTSSGGGLKGALSKQR